jgi:hypothetical protein
METCNLLMMARFATQPSKGKYGRQVDQRLSQSASQSFIGKWRNNDMLNSQLTLTKDHVSEDREIRPDTANDFHVSERHLFSQFF